jgi:hypothetical protein
MQKEPCLQIDREFYGNPKTRTFAELLIDCEDQTLRAVPVGMLPED